MKDSQKTSNLSQYDTDELINKIRIRTGMYTGGESLQSLKTFLGAVNYLLYDLGIESLGIVGGDYFYSWLTDKYKFGSNCIGWENIITAIALGYKNANEISDWDDFNRDLTSEDHEKARQLFFKLFDECRKEKAILNG